MSFGSGFNPLSGGKGKGSDAPVEAARVQAASGAQAIDEQRRQFDAITAMLAPFLSAGTEALPGVVGGSTAGGLDARLAEILGTDAFKSLLGERTRSVENHLGNVGLTRSGFGSKAAAAIPSDLALQIEQLLFGRQQGLAGAGQNAAAMQGQFGANMANNVGDIQMRVGEAMGQGIIGQGQAQAAQLTNLINAGTSIATAAIMFSDPRLKKNMEPIGKIGPLTLYEWDWKDNVRGVTGAEMSIGFNADEVDEHFPEFVIERHGFKAIYYPGLTEHLRKIVEEA